MEKKITFIGADVRFWKNLQEEYLNTYAKVDKFKFSDCFEKGDEKYKIIFKKIISINPHILYLDISTEAESLLKLGSLLRRVFRTRGITVVVLYGPMTEEKYRRQASSLGILASQLKSPDDLQSLVYIPSYIAFPETALEPKTHLVKIKGAKPFEINQYVRVGYISKTSMLIESNEEFESKQIVEINSLIHKELSISKQFLVSNISKSNLFYDYNSSAILQFLYVDPIEIPKDPNDDEKEKYERKVGLREKEIEEIKGELDKWLADKVSSSSPKQVKISFIDNQFTIFNQTESWIGDYDLSIRVQSQYHEFEKEMERYRPDIIVYQFETVPQNVLEEKEKEVKEKEDPKNEEKKKKNIPEIMNYNEIEGLKYITNEISKIEDYSPIIIAFNCEKEIYQSVRKHADYPKILPNFETFSFERIIELGQVMKKKGKSKEDETQDEILYIDKYDDLSFAQMSQKVELVTISELALEVASENPLAMHNTFFISFPAKLYFTVVPNRKNSPRPPPKKQIYRGLIHSYGVEDIKQLRQFLISQKK